MINLTLVDQLILGAIAVFAVMFGFFLLRSRRKPEPYVTVKEWEPTGRLDFQFPPGVDASVQTTCILVAEDRRVVASAFEIEHHEVRWRRATLAEAKTIIVAYHGVKFPTAEPKIPELEQLK